VRANGIFNSMRCNGLRGIKNKSCKAGDGVNCQGRSLKVRSAASEGANTPDLVPKALFFVTLSLASREGFNTMKNKTHTQQTGDVTSPSSNEEITIVNTSTPASEALEVRKDFRDLADKVKALRPLALGELFAHGGRFANVKTGRLDRESSHVLALVLALHPESDYSSLVGNGLKEWRSRMSPCKFAPFAIDGKASLTRLARSVKLRTVDE